MDGTLVDSEEYWIATEIAMAARAGGNWTHEDGIQLIGSSLTHSARILRERTGVPGSDDEIVDEMVRGVMELMREHGVIWRPGARELLITLREAEVPLALVTMSYRNLAETIAAELPDGTFHTIITGDEVTNGKPHPEPYLLAAAAIGVDITACIGIEDSPIGLTAVEASGARAIGVPCLAEIPAVPGRNRVRSLEELTLADLRAIVSGDVIDRLA